jgi:hydrogenase nickel incorporation protein HypB
MQIKVMQNVLQANANKAAEIRELLKQKKIFMVNLISSPGSGKTSLLEKTLPIFKESHRIAVIEGDVETDKDARRLEKYGVPIALINTSGACHLESVSIEKAFSVLNLNDLDVIFVENVGNLVCPAEFDIGEDAKVAIVSTPEGDDKPMKYPLLFREATLVVLNKVDLLQHVDFAVSNFYTDLKKLNHKLVTIEISCTKNLGIASWIKWLEEQVAKKKV